MSLPEDLSKDVHDDLEDHHATESNFYGIAPGIAGLLFAAALIAFMFAVADGFA